MVSGIQKNIIACIPSENGVTEPPCTYSNGIHHKPVMQDVYVIDSSNTELFEGAVDQLRSADVAVVFSTAFSIVLLFFLIGRGVGTVLSLIRKG